MYFLSVPSRITMSSPAYRATLLYYLTSDNDLLGRSIKCSVVR